MRAVPSAYPKRRRLARFSGAAAFSRRRRHVRRCRRGIDSLPVSFSRAKTPKRTETNNRRHGQYGLNSKETNIDEQLRLPSLPLFGLVTFRTSAPIGDVGGTNDAQHDQSFRDQSSLRIARAVGPRGRGGRRTLGALRKPVRRG